MLVSLLHSFLTLSSRAETPAVELSMCLFCSTFLALNSTSLSLDHLAPDGFIFFFLVEVLEVAGTPSTVSEHLYLVVSLQFLVSRTNSALSPLALAARNILST